MDHNSEADKPASLSEEAADWLFKLKDNPHDQELIGQFQNWRALDASHEAAWIRMCKVWKGLGVVAPEHLQSDTPAIHQQQIGQPAAFTEVTVKHRRWFTARRAVTATTMAIAACILILLAPIWILRLQADHYTRTGEVMTVRLEDGSSVTLAGASAIKTRMSDEGRFVELLDGEAYFDVAHEPDRRFVVSATGLNVTVLGTEFNVRQGWETTDVALRTGSIDTSSVPDGKKIARLRPGQLLELRTSDGATEMSDIDPGHIGAWRNRKLFVSNQTVASVAEQIGRYQSGWVTIPDWNLASQRVTGVYDLSEPERALRTLVAPFGGEVIEISNYLHVLTRTK
ncbi:MAG: FecR family protein [Pseudomonadota bacterium]